MINKLVSKHVLDFDNYQVADNKYKYVLNANESPYNIFEYITDEINDALITYRPNLYPDPMSSKLRQKLAEYNDVKDENIICGNGSDEIISMILTTFISEGDTVVTHSPTFDMYSLATKLVKGKCIAVKDDDNFNIQSDELVKTVRESNAKILFLCVPNNPTGYAIPKAEIVNIVEQTSCIVVIDEAYGEFYDNSCVDLTKAYENVIVLKTLSKAFGLAGLRIGYAISSESIINWMYKVKQPYNLNSLSQLLAEVVLDNISIVESFTSTIKSQREILYKKLLELEEFKVYKSDSNFILAKYKKDSRLLNDYLLSKGILLKHYQGKHPLSNSFRISVSTAEINSILLDTIKEGILNEK